MCVKYSTLTYEMLLFTHIRSAIKANSFLFTSTIFDFFFRFSKDVTNNDGFDGRASRTSTTETSPKEH